jgi:hypothetical protein
MLFLRVGESGQFTERYGFYFLDSRLVSIEFRGGGKLARGEDLRTTDTFAFRIDQQSIGYGSPGDQITRLPSRIYRFPFQK